MASEPDVGDVPLKDVRDTIVVPVRRESFERLLVGERSWYPIRIGDERVASIRHLATYFPAPTSAITHVVSVKSIVPFPGPYQDHRDWNKDLVNVGEDLRQIDQVAAGIRVKSIQSLRYALLSELLAASSLDDLW